MGLPLSPRTTRETLGVGEPVRLKQVRDRGDDMLRHGSGDHLVSEGIGVEIVRKIHRCMDCLGCQGRSATETHDLLRLAIGVDTAIVPQ